MAILCCKDCEDRSPGCHANCKQYKREKYELQQAKKFLRSFDDEYTSAHQRRNRDYKRGRM